MLNKTIFILFLLFATISSFSQSSFNLPNLEKDKIRFELVGNLIIIPVELNGVKLSFVLDTGVSKPILFNLTNIDSLQIYKAETIMLRGLGGGDPVEAIKSKNNLLKVGNAINVNQDVYVVFDKDLNFTPRLGIPIHGIIGFSLFRSFIVEVNYSSKYIKLHKPDTYKYRRCKRCETFSISFYNNKPYIEGEVQIDSLYTPVKLLIDTGSSDALWLFEDESLGIKPPDKMYFNDFLGKGLSGNIYGKRSKVQTFKLKTFELNDVNSAFPDSSAISHARKFTKRNGSVCGDLLKRFNIIVDYKNARLTLKKNKNFKSPFYYNRSGIIIEQRGFIVVKEEEASKNVNYGSPKYSNTIKLNAVNHYTYTTKPAYTIVEMREDSPAEQAGLLKGDILLTINGKETHTLGLQKVIGYFKSKEGRPIKLTVDRNGSILSYQFKLKDVFKQKELP
ncbi:aspartyl protease family protein [Psychroserpens mesophilus]|uniref:aspartyl protease family protein n=1 Tax=Psychroserpens mesophilus TaxID=325473 RepID=UPI003D648B31